MIQKPFSATASVLIALLVLTAPLAGSQEQAEAARLAAILKKAADYCRQLDRAALDFVCLEEVTESSYFLMPSTDVYLYDYQVVRKSGETKERRDLVAVNGKKATARDTPLHTVWFQYKNVLFGPVGLLSEARQPHLTYKIAGEEKVTGRKAVIIQAVPKPSLGELHPYGKIWIREDDGSVLKIDWDQKSLGGFKMVEDWARDHEAEPLIVAYSEYGFEKNGLRFPSRSYTEQALVRKDRGKQSNASISIRYKSYRFFTVETETKY